MNTPDTAELAFVSSGLGHVGRGNERGATSAAEAMHAAGASVLLIGGGPCKPRCPYVRVGNIRRDQPLLRWLPWDKRYLLEQYTFLAGALRQIARHGVRVVVAADPALALLLHRRSGRARFKVVYQDGLLLGPPWCAKFDHVQVLAPHYLEQGRLAGCGTGGWRVIPHLVDLKTFANDPAGLSERRKWLGPSYNEGEPVVLGVGDFAGASRKRLDWVASEVARLPGELRTHALFVGHCEGEAGSAFMRTTSELLGNRAHFKTNIPPTEMGGAFRCADVFAHAALREPFGIVLIEAMACGLPVVGHRFAVTEWIISDGGICIDMTQPGMLESLLRAWLGEGDAALRRSIGERARRRAESVFSPDAVAPLYAQLLRDMVRGAL